MVTMKSNLILFLLLLFLSYSCTTYYDFDKEKAFVFDIADSSQVVIGAENWNGPGDCSAIAYLNRTETGLLITIKVRDDSVRTGNEFSYMNDGVEIYMDLRPPRTNKRNVYEKGVFQAVIIPLPGKKNSAPVEWYPKNYSSEVSGARAWTQLHDSSYVVQVLFPYSNLKRNHYWPRTHFSMDIAINDADSMNRETQMMWRGKADNWSNPVNFYPVTLKADSTLKLRTRRTTQDKPNILFIITDQQAQNAMGAYGNPYLQTPNMDALAEAGIRFGQSYCSSPGCSPSMSSLLTGMYPHQAGVNYNGEKPDSTLENMGQFFRRAGYRTYWGGRWDLPEIYPQSDGKDSVPGFNLVNFLSPEKTTDYGSDTDGPLAAAMVKQLQRRPDEPWMMVVSFRNPHDIAYQPARKGAYLPAVNQESLPPTPFNFDADPSEPQFLKDCRNRINYENELFLSKRYSPMEWRNYIHQYYRMVEKLDREIGNIISALERQGFDENTLIVFTSDHGNGSGAHHWAGKLSPYDEAMKVPLVISWFGKNFSSKTDNFHLVSGIDILPTMLDYAGIDIPNTMAGRSLKPIIENPDTSFREFIISEIAPDPAKPERLGRMIRYRNYKYVVYSYGTPNEQLFDLKADPGEMKNLANYSEYVEMKDFLLSNLNSRMKKYNDYFSQGQ